LWLVVAIVAEMSGKRLAQQTAWRMKRALENHKSQRQKQLFIHNGTALLRTENRELRTSTSQLFLTCALVVQIQVAEHKSLKRNFSRAAQTQPLVRQPQLLSTHA
jgi:hypothetical protein